MIHSLRKITSLIITFLTVYQYSNAQSASNHYSLSDAIKFGLSNQPTILKSDFELLKYNQRFKEAMAAFLPQIKADGSYIYNIKLQSQIVPGEFLGQPGTDVAVPFGTKYNASATVELTQSVIDRTQTMAVRLAKESSQIALLSKQKNIEQSIYDIAHAYYLAQITFLQKDITEANLNKIDSLIKITEAQLSNGFAKKNDLNRLLVSKTNLTTELQNIALDYQQQLTILKYYMAYPLQNELTIDNEIDKKVLNLTDLQSQSIKSIDLQELTLQNSIDDLSIKQLKASYMPKLSFVFKYGTLLQQEQANIFKQGAQWLGNSMAGLNLSIPIFDGNAKRAKINQLKLTQAQTNLDIKNLENEQSMKVRNAQAKLTSNLSSLSSQKSNIHLAEEVYAVTKIQYENGFNTMSELLNAETSLKEAQSNYIKALAQVQLARLELLKVSGNIQTITQ